MIEVKYSSRPVLRWLAGPGDSCRRPVGYSSDSPDDNEGDHDSADEQPGLLAAGEIEMVGLPVPAAHEEYRGGETLRFLSGR